MRPGDLLEQRYRLVRVLGRGRSGTVWCARNELIDRAVAVKVLHSQLASDPERLSRFFQEARACGRVRHPSVVEVLDLGQSDDGVLFLVMELLEGETMSSLLARRGKLQTDEALALMVPIARGLAAAHAHGILHRDLKPANIYLHKTPTGSLQPKILDFGISKIVGTEFTSSGVVLGTPSYMSPEQARGQELDPRSDVWALGVILYECLAGRLPFLAKDYRSLVAEITEAKPPKLGELGADVPDDLARLVEETLEKSPERRLASALSLAQKLTFVLRRRGRDDLLRDPDDDFSDGAPTLTRDRASFEETATATAPLVFFGGPSPTTSAANAPAASAPRRTLPAPGLNEPVITERQPSASTAAIAAQTGGARRTDDGPAMRPAAGASPTSAAASKPASQEPDTLPSDGDADTTAPKMTTSAWEVASARAAVGRAEVLLGAGLAAKTPAVNADWDTTVADASHEQIERTGNAPESAVSSAAPTLPRTTTGAWEVPRSAAATTGEPTRAAPAATSTREPSKESTKLEGAPTGRTLRPAPMLDDSVKTVDAKSTGFAAIPGFSAPTPAPPTGKPLTAPPPPVGPRPALPTPRKSTPPPPPVASAPAQGGGPPGPPPKKSTPPPPAVASPAAHPAGPPGPPPKKSTPPPPAVASPSAHPAGPPGPPPKKSTPPPPAVASTAVQLAAAPPATLHKPTLRPPPTGFAVPAAPVIALDVPASREGARVGEVSRAPELSPEVTPAAPPPLSAIDSSPSAAAASTVIGPPPSSDATPFALSEAQASPFDLLRAPAVPVVSAASAPSPLESTQPRVRRARLRGRALLAAVGSVFAIGALIGTVAASSRARAAGVPRLAAADALLMAWHRAELDLDDAEAADRKAKELAARQEQERLAREADARAAAAASASASAAAAASASASAAAASKPPTRPTTPTGGGATKTTKSTTPTGGKSGAKGAASSTPKKGYSSGDAPTKKNGDKEWWQKKF